MNELDMKFPQPMRSGFGEVPVGAVIAYAGDLSPPDPHFNQGNPLEAWGWMVCDGRTLSAYQYPELFAVLGYRYGGQDEQFQIPDYRRAPLHGTDTETSEVTDARDLPYVIKFTFGFAHQTR